MNVVKSMFGLWDLFLVPIYLIFFLLIGYAFASTKYGKSNPALAKHFMQGLVLKFVGCIAFIAVYALYYKGGDTFRYFQNSLPILDLAYKDPMLYIKLMNEKSVKIFSEYPMLLQDAKPHYRFDMAHSATSYQVIKFITLFALVGFRSYFVVSLFFAFFSYIGVWCLFRSFVYQYPKYMNAMAIPILYFPTVYFWGSSIMKDSVVLGFLGLLIYSIYMLLFKKRRILINLFLVIVSFSVLKTTKEYVIISFLPALIIWVILSSANNLPPLGRKLMKPGLLIFSVLIIVVLAPQIGKITEKYALESVLETASTTATWIYKVSEKTGGSAYTLGEVSYTPLGLVKVFPKAVNVTLFRPYLYEVKNPVMLLSALESLGLLLFTIYTIFYVGPARLLARITSDPFLFASLIFSIFFAFAVGVSTFNFGSLARYKLPCLPFYILALMVPFMETRDKKLAAKDGKKAELPTDTRLYKPIP